MAAPALRVMTDHAARLANPAVREALLKFVRRRLPPAEVDDLVQNTLADALDSSSAPTSETDFRRWLRGIARHKIADLYRRRGRLPQFSGEADPGVDDPGPATEELSQWIERELPKTAGAQATLHWLLRESDGETLDEIARDAALPAPRVRQRVSRLRRYFQSRWLALGAAGLSLLLGLGVALRVKSGAPVSAPSISREDPSPLERARSLRQRALERCAAAAYPECLARLDDAKALDPIGEEAHAVRAARADAARALGPEPSPMATAPAPELGSKSTPKQQASPKRLAPTTPKKQLPKPRTPMKLEPVPKQKAAPMKLDALPNQKAAPVELDTVPSQQAAPLLNSPPTGSNQAHKPTKD